MKASEKIIMQRVLIPTRIRDWPWPAHDRSRDISSILKIVRCRRETISGLATDNQSAIETAAKKHRDLINSPNKYAIIMIGENRSNYYRKDKNHGYVWTVTK